MKTNRTKLIAILLFAASVFVLTIFKEAPTTTAASRVDDPATSYKAKCAMCHTPTASKFFNPDVPEAQQVDAILKGKKAEKPPNMPGFEAKGMTADEAKALAAYMKTLKPTN
ncbi:hypothetical protein BH10ACI2_BH10ACI2_07320 [soil metagenome]